jgi:hypothetical protein
MDTNDRDAARQLAISYNAYMEYMGKPDCELAARFWGKVLLEAQRKTGIELLSSLALLYPLTGDETAKDRARASFAAYASDKAIEARAGVRAAAPDDSEGDGGALVPAPAPQPRKPSPGVSLEASAWLAGRAR